MITQDLGSCCNCGSTNDVIFIVSLEYKAPIPGEGWGCVVCGLPPDGAVAVLCIECKNYLQLNKSNEILKVCVGYPGKNQRIPYSEFIKTAEPFDHNRTKHAANRYPLYKN